MLGAVAVVLVPDNASASCSDDGPGPDVTFVGTAVSATGRPGWATDPGGTQARFAVHEVWQERPNAALEDRVEVRADLSDVPDGFRPASWEPPLFQPGERYLIAAVISPTNELLMAHCRSGASLWTDDVALRRPDGTRFVDQPDDIPIQPWSRGLPWDSMLLVTVVGGLVIAAGALARLVWVGERSGYEPRPRRGAS